MTEIFNSVIFTLIISFICGAISGIGIGGGSILLIFMSLILNMEQLQAQYINLLYFIPTAIFALIWHIKNKLIVFHKGIVATIFGIGGAVAGSYLAMAIDPWLLKKIFALLLLYIGITQLFQKEKKPEEKK